MKKNSTKKFFATLLSAAMILTSTGVSMIDGAKADAAGKAVLKQAKKTVSIRQGKKTTLKIKKKNIKWRHVSGYQCQVRLLRSRSGRLLYQG